MDIRKIDLNLLITFEVLMHERNVTRAAFVLDRTQSAISHALTRLREQLQDPLLIKQNGQMHPSPLAIELIQKITPILSNLRQILTGREEFDPQTSNLTLRIAANDFAYSIFPRVMAELLQLAPNLALEWILMDMGTLRKLLDGECDLVILPYQMQVPDGISQAYLGSMKWSCYGRKGHPAFAHWGIEAWRRWPHAAVRIPDKLYNPVLDAEVQIGESRQVKAWLPQLSAIPPLLACSDLLTTQLDILMESEIDRYDLERHPSPVPISDTAQYLLWNSRTANEPALAWLRQHTLALCQKIYLNNSL